MHLLGRPALLGVWVVALWGTLLGLSLGLSAFEVGPWETLMRLVPGREATAWHYLNAASVLVALAAWALVATAVVVSRRDRPEA